MYPSEAKRGEIDKQLELFISAGGIFGHVMAKETRNKKHPALWWKSYGDSVPELQRVVVRILSATFSVSGCERNWSIFEQVHTKRRNRLITKRKDQGDTYDPICMSDMESDDEWIIEKEDALNLSTMKLAQGKGHIKEREIRLVDEIEEVEEDEEETHVEEISENQIQEQSDDEWLDDGYNLGV
ncbi:hypothetical protein MKX01_001240 [Papaver californicum]|nr:hypothetical protein MKX01_001240 [Papaver californicum]